MVRSDMYCLSSGDGPSPLDLANESFQCLAGVQHVIWDPSVALANGIIGKFSAIAYSQQVLTEWPGFFCLLARIRSLVVSSDTLWKNHQQY